jgi:UDP-glucuronate 4-epimerase
MKIIVTGAAGFIGYSVSMHLLERGDEVVGVDNLNDYYDVKLKEDRLKQLAPHDNFKFIKLDLASREGTADLFKSEKAHRVIHLAAQAGVRYSIENPHAYVDANIQAFINILEGCRHNEVEHLTYASSSSVYGANTKMPFSIHQNIDHPLSLYAATKKANELMAHTYSHLYSIPTTGLRFFTVYGPWGRPDMAYFKFVKMITNGEPIDVYNNGKHKRDFTYIDDIVEGVVRVLDKTATNNEKWSSDSPDPGTSSAPYRIFNIGNNKPVDLMDFIHVIEKELGLKAEINFLPKQPGDVDETFADIEDLAEYVDYRPVTDIEHGIANFVRWYKSYY